MFLLTAWQWLKKYWMLVAGILVTALGFVMGVSTKKRPVITQGSDPQKKALEQQEQKQVDEAQTQHDVVVAQDQAQAQQEQAQVVQQEVKATDTAKTDTQATNEYLLNVSKEMGEK